MGCRPESKSIWDDDGIVQQECREGPRTQEARNRKGRTCLLIHAAGYALAAFIPETETQTTHTETNHERPSISTKLKIPDTMIAISCTPPERIVPNLLADGSGPNCGLHLFLHSGDCLAPSPSRNLALVKFVDLGCGSTVRSANLWMCFSVIRDLPLGLGDEQPHADTDGQRESAIHESGHERKIE